MCLLPHFAAFTSKKKFKNAVWCFTVLFLARGGL